MKLCIIKKIHPAPFGLLLSAVLLEENVSGDLDSAQLSDSCCRMNVVKTHKNPTTAHRGVTIQDDKDERWKNTLLFSKPCESVFFIVSPTAPLWDINKRRRSQWLMGIKHVIFISYVLFFLNNFSKIKTHFYFLSLKKSVLKTNRA